MSQSSPANLADSCRRYIPDLHTALRVAGPAPGRLHDRRHPTMATTMDAIAAPRPLEYLPIGFFGATMGLTGLSVAWKLAHGFFDSPLWIAELIAAVAVLVFLALLAGYVIKLISAPAKVLSEFRHPIAGNLFGPFLISLLLLPIVIAPLSLPVAQIMWCVGAAGMALFTWIIVNRWMSDRQQTAHATPAWIVPI